MEDIGQVQPGQKPTKEKIDATNEQSGPRPQLSWGGKHASQQVEKNDQIAVDVIYLHDDPACVDSSRNQNPFQVIS
jgi:hypothetical protein